MEKNIVWAFGLVALLAACGGEEKVGAGDGKLSLKDGASLEMAVSCSVTELTCPDNGICAVVNLAQGAIGPVCVSPQICDELECDVGSCFIAESAPSQVFCKN